MLLAQVDPAPKRITSSRFVDETTSAVESTDNDCAAPSMVAVCASPTGAALEPSGVAATLVGAARSLLGPDEVISVAEPLRESSLVAVLGGGRGQLEHWLANLLPEVPRELLGWNRSIADIADAISRSHGRLLVSCCRF